MRWGAPLPGVAGGGQVHIYNLPYNLQQQYGTVSQLQLLAQKRLEAIPTNQFPYKEGEYVIDDKNHGEMFRGFARAATLADPLSVSNKQVHRIGRHIEIEQSKHRYRIVIHKGVPPKGLKLLCGKIKHHLKSLPNAHIELFRKDGHQMKIVASHAKLRSISPKELARLLLTQLGKKAHVQLVIMQTMAGGSLGSKYHNSYHAHRNILNSL